MFEHEGTLYSTMKEQNRFLRKLVVLLCAVMVLVNGYALYTTLTRKDKVIALDSKGQPSFVEFQDDRIFKSEATFLIRLVVEKVFNVHYGMLMNKSAWDNYVNSFKDFFVPRFLKKFIEGLNDSGFYESVRSGKLILTPSTIAIRDVKTDGKKVYAFVTVGLSSVTRAGSVDYATKVYEIRLIRWERTLENPWGLYVYYLVEH